jgi:hypothetical protein
VLELLWDSCYEAGEDFVGTAEDIEHAIGWTGDAGVLTRALAEAGLPAGVGFIERVEGVGGEPVYRVHDLWHHAPEYVAKRRKRELDRQGKAAPERRALDDRRTAPNGGHCPPTSDWQNENGDTPSPSPSHSPSPSPVKNVSAEAECFLSFPVIGSGTDTWVLSVAQVTEWECLFPGFDVRGECRKALAWVKANLGRRKTAKGMARFLVSWLSRAVDSGRGRRHEPSASQPNDFSGDAWSCPHTPRCPHRTACWVVSQRKVSA